MPESDLDMSEYATNRRTFIGRVTLAIGLATFVGGGIAPRPAAAAPAKLPPGEIGYQPSPKGKARCELCVNWQAPNACKLVAGAISPTGWCGLFASRS
jgi:hypothetical protein